MDSFEAEVVDVLKERIARTECTKDDVFSVIDNYIECAIILCGADITVDSREQCLFIQRLALKLAEYVPVFAEEIAEEMGLDLA